MQAAIIFSFLCSAATIISADTYHDEWWKEYYFLKFNPSSGKSFYINFYDGTIYQWSSKEPKNSPFISFISMDLKIYDIYFQHNDLSYTPRLEKSKFNTQTQHLIRHRLHTFVGPDKKMYQLIYNDGKEPKITEKSTETLDHFQIKTFGPYEKWEHTYDFNENGELIVDHTISPVPLSPDRSIIVPKLDSSTFLSKHFIGLLATFNTPSGTKYYITKQLSIIPILDGSEIAETAYITFTETDRRTYDICIDKEDGHPFLVENNSVEYFHTNNKQKLHSFVAPNQMLYRIDHEYDKVPVLVSQLIKISKLQLTFIEPKMFYNRYVKYIFSDNGTKILTRVDEIDWTPLNEKPAIPIAEVNAGYVMVNKPFLTLYTPSGNNYHIFTNETDATIAVERGAKISQSLYISYFQRNGRKANIYFNPGDHPYIVEETNLTETDKPALFYLTSFVTPDQMMYSIQTILDDEWKESIHLPSQVIEPIDLIPEEGLSIKLLSDNYFEYFYRFTWSGDKLIQVGRYFRPVILKEESWDSDVHIKTLASLVGK